MVGKFGCIVSFVKGFLISMFDIMSFNRFVIWF